MRRAVLVTAIIVVVILAEIMVAKANPVVPPYVDFLSPKEYNFKVYQTANVSLLVFAEKTHYYPDFTNISYSLDGNPKRTLAINRTQINGEEFHSAIDASYSAGENLYNLKNGFHSLIGYATDSKGKTTIFQRTFLVNTSFVYPSFLLSPSNTSYNKHEVPLVYTINQAISPSERLSVGYSLDDETKTVRGNTTITGLESGQHKITVLALINGSLYSEQSAYFTINASPNPTPTIPELPTATVTELPATSYLPLNRNAPHLDPIFYLLPISIILIVIIAAIVVYRKRKLRSKQSLL